MSRPQNPIPISDGRGIGRMMISDCTHGPLSAQPCRFSLLSCPSLESVFLGKRSAADVFDGLAPQQHCCYQCSKLVVPFCLFCEVLGKSDLSLCQYVSITVHSFFSLELGCSQQEKANRDFLDSEPPLHLVFTFLFTVSNCSPTQRLCRGSM